jgi:hypothetical protein
MAADVAERSRGGKKKLAPGESFSAAQTNTPREWATTPDHPVIAIGAVHPTISPL